jgi:hypothetical protein
MILLLPLVTLLFPLFKILPPVYRWRVRSKVYRWYRAVRSIDIALAAYPGAAELSQLSSELDRIEYEVRRLLVPLAYSEAHYNLRLHIDLLRRKVDRALAALRAGEAAQP